MRGEGRPRHMLEKPNCTLTLVWAHSGVCFSGWLLVFRLVLRFHFMFCWAFAGLTVVGIVTCAITSAETTYYHSLPTTTHYLLKLLERSLGCPKSHQEFLDLGYRVFRYLDYLSSISFSKGAQASGTRPETDWMLEDKPAIYAQIDKYSVQIVSGCCDCEAALSE